VKTLVGVGDSISIAGITTLEDYSHIIELESDDAAPWGGTQQFLGCVGMATGLTSGVAVVPPYIHPTNIPVSPGSHIKFSTTFNKALTINPSIRGQLVFE